MFICFSASIYFTFTTSGAFVSSFRLRVHITGILEVGRTFKGAGKESACRIVIRFVSAPVPLVFLVATKQLFKGVPPLGSPSVRQSVDPSVKFLLSGLL